MGMIYLRGKTYWIKYYRNRKPYRESARSRKEGQATLEEEGRGDLRGQVAGGLFRQGEV